MNNLAGKSVAILATDGFEQSELSSPKDALEKAGASVHIVSVESGKIKGWSGDNWGDEFKVSKTLDNANSDDYDALVLPGGLINPDTLRQNEKAIKFVSAFFDDDRQRPVAAICHGPWLLAEAAQVSGKRLTSFPSIQTDLKNAGAHWEDKEVVVDGQIITSRKPDDLDAFNKAIIDALVA
uniref:type 1 glutamine amidotransferase domain-containing protein n=1 Tax=Ningiella ruwaisensis TaxID=2364274 RepID=UPI00109F35DA|nr:type 1 glutamine amidotransferase domain-containing protein [Ningiella ruwaisensis]